VKATFIPEVDNTYLWNECCSCWDFSYIILSKPTNSDAVLLQDDACCLLPVYVLSIFWTAYRTISLISLAYQLDEYRCCTAPNPANYSNALLKWLIFPGSWVFRSLLDYLCRRFYTVVFSFIFKWQLLVQYAALLPCHYCSLCMCCFTSVFWRIKWRRRWWWYTE